MAATRLFGQRPYPSLQGNKPVCVREALAKAVAAGLDKGTWYSRRFDVDQKVVTAILNHAHKFSINNEINPVNLSGTVLKLQNEADGNKFEEFIMVVKEMTKAEWYKSKRTNEYLIGKDEHCLYVERMTDDGKTLNCLNSWGDKYDPRPQYKTEETSDIWEVVLITAADQQHQPTAADQRLIKSLQNKELKQVRESSSTTAPDNLQLRAFLEKWNLTEIYEQLSSNGITLNDLPDITHQDLKDAGIKAFQHRKKLLGAIRENSSSGSIRTEPDPTNNTEVTRRQLASIAISSDPVPDFPTTLTVRSDQGPTGEKQWEKMGEYTRSEEVHNNKPVWTNWDYSMKIYYHSDGKWSIGASYTASGIKSAKPGLLSPLSVGTGWLYHAGADDVWSPAADTLLTVTAGPPVYPATVKVTSTGPAGQRHPTSMGVFTGGEASSNGRPVWRNDNNMFLFYNGSRWLIGSDYTKNVGYIESARQGLVGLDTQWEYADGTGTWPLDKTIKIV